MQAARGFTLLELLVAVAIFALLGVGSYRLLASTISVRDTAKAHDAALIQLQRSFIVMNRDLSQAVARPIRDQYGDAVA
ncbi:MAG: type II secretion system minor pseudopilin GspJ, partial [Pseudomonadales bacterium]|nr:type II secretion system minor pseudopilin GspJ [Pseudomonadales bacterium]